MMMTMTVVVADGHCRTARGSAAGLPRDAAQCSASVAVTSDAPNIPHRPASIANKKTERLQG